MPRPRSRSCARDRAGGNADETRPAFASARAGFEYRLLTDLETPAELADTFGWYAVEGNFAYAPASSRYFHVAAELTPQAVARTVARYLTASPAVVTLVRARPAATPKPS